MKHLIDIIDLSVEEIDELIAVGEDIIAHPADYEEDLFGARAATDLDEKKALLKEASRMLTSDYCLILPMAATFSTCFSNDKVADSGIYQTSSVLWTPEDIKIVE